MSATGLRIPRLAMLAVAGVLALAVALLWLRSDDARHRVENILADGIGRPVTIGTMDVHWGGVALEAVEVGNPPGFEGDPFFTAAMVELDVTLPQLLRSRVVGSVRARGVQLRVAKQGKTTNVEGIAPRPTGESDRAFALEVSIEGAVVMLEDLDRGESIRLEDVALGLTLASRDAGSDVRAEISVAEVRVRGVGLDEVSATIVASRERVQLQDLRAKIGAAGTLEGTGRVALDEVMDWSCGITLADVSLDEDVAAAVSAFYPGFGAGKPGPGGTVAMSVTTSGRGLSTSSLLADLRVELHDVRFAEDTLIGELASLAGFEDPVEVDTVTVRGAVSEGWFTLWEVSSVPPSDLLSLRGRVSLAGELDLTVDLLPVLRVASPGIHASARDLASSLPIRIVGSTQAPEVAAPRAEDIAASLLGGLLHRGLQ